MGQICHIGAMITFAANTVKSDRGLKFAGVQRARQR